MRKATSILVLLTLITIACCLSCKQEPQPQHIHTFSTEWTSDATYHWHAATCGHDVVADKAIHVPDDYGKCSVCSYESIDFMFEITSDGVLSVKSEYKDKLPNELIVPKTVLGIRVNSIGNNAFKDCTGLTSVIIPDSVTSIGYNSFEGCTGLKTISLPFVGDGSSETYLGYLFGAVRLKDNTAFVPSSLEKVIVTSAKSIGLGAFYGCENIKSVTVPDSVTNIGDGAFYGCTGLTNVVIGNSVTIIGECAFYGCTDLSSISIPDHVTSIEDFAFSKCTSLTSITIPDSVTSFGEYAFYDCTGLTSVTIGSSVTNIDSSAFDGCIGLTSINIPDSVTSIGEYAFYDCTGLTRITFTGTKSQWGAISKEEYWVYSVPATVVHCSDGDVEI